MTPGLVLSHHVNWESVRAVCHSREEWWGETRRQEVVRERELPRSLLCLLPWISLRSWGHHSVPAFGICDINLRPHCNVLLLLKLAPLVTYHPALRHVALSPALDRRLMLPVNSRLRIWRWEFDLKSVLVSTLLCPGTTICLLQLIPQRPNPSFGFREGVLKAERGRGCRVCDRLLHSAQIG